MSSPTARTPDKITRSKTRIKDFDIPEELLDRNSVPFTSIYDLRHAKDELKCTAEKELKTLPWYLLLEHTILGSKFYIQDYQKHVCTEDQMHTFIKCDIPLIIKAIKSKKDGITDEQVFDSICSIRVRIDDLILMVSSHRGTMLSTVSQYKVCDTYYYEDLTMGLDDEIQQLYGKKFKIMNHMCVKDYRSASVSHPDYIYLGTPPFIHENGFVAYQHFQKVGGCEKIHSRFSELHGKTIHNGEVINIPTVIYLLIHYLLKGRNTIFDGLIYPPRVYSFMVRMSPTVPLAGLCYMILNQLKTSCRTVSELYSEASIYNTESVICGNRYIHTRSSMKEFNKFRDNPFYRLGVRMVKQCFIDIETNPGPKVSIECLDKVLTAISLKPDFILHGTYPSILVGKIDELISKILIAKGWLAKIKSNKFKYPRSSYYDYADGSDLAATQKKFDRVGADKIVMERELLSKADKVNFVFDDIKEAIMYVNAIYMLESSYQMQPYDSISIYCSDSFIDYMYSESESLQVAWATALHSAYHLHGKHPIVEELPKLIYHLNNRFIFSYLWGSDLDGLGESKCNCTGFCKNTATCM